MPLRPGIILSEDLSHFSSHPLHRMDPMNTISWKYTDLVDSQESCLDDVRQRGLCLGGGIQAIMSENSGETTISLNRTFLENAEKVWSDGLMALTSRRWLTDCVAHIVLTQAIVLGLSLSVQGFFALYPTVALCFVYIIFLKWGSRWRLVVNGRHGQVRKVLRGDALKRGFLVMGASIGAWDQAMVIAAFAVVSFPDVQIVKIGGSRDSPVITMTLSRNRERVINYGPQDATDMHGQQLRAEAVHRLSKSLGNKPAFLLRLVGIASSSTFHEVAKTTRAYDKTNGTERSVSSHLEGMAIYGHGQESFFKLGGMARSRQQGVVCIGGELFHCQEDPYYRETAVSGHRSQFVAATGVKRQGSFMDQTLSYIGFLGTCSLTYVTAQASLDPVFFIALLINLMGEILATVVSIRMYGRYGGNPLMHAIDPFHSALTWTYRGRRQGRFVVWLEGLAGAISATFIVVARVTQGGGLEPEALLAWASLLVMVLTVLLGPSETALFTAYISEFLLEIGIILALIYSNSPGLVGLLIALVATLAETCELLYLAYNLLENWASSRDNGFLCFGALGLGERNSLLARRKRWDVILTPSKVVIEVEDLSAIVSTPIIASCEFRELGSLGTIELSSGDRFSSRHSRLGVQEPCSTVWFKMGNDLEQSMAGPDRESCTMKISSSVAGWLAGAADIIGDKVIIVAGIWLSVAAGCN